MLTYSNIYTSAEYSHKRVCRSYTIPQTSSITIILAIITSTTTTYHRHDCRMLYAPAASLRATSLVVSSDEVAIIATATEGFGGRKKENEFTPHRDRRGKSTPWQGAVRSGNGIGCREQRRRWGGREGGEFVHGANDAIQAHRHESRPYQFDVAGVGRTIFESHLDVVDDVIRGGDGWRERRQRISRHDQGMAHPPWIRTYHDERARFAFGRRAREEEWRRISQRRHVRGRGRGKAYEQQWF
jgi:hypothetical protein